MIDGLTGAHQRTPGLTELEREIGKARRTGQPFTLAFLDVDGLKNVNDTRGHTAGDELLVQAVTTVRRAVREYDLIVRYGGDEFVCGLLGLDADTVANRFEETSKALTGQGVLFSIGFAALTAGDTLQDLIDRADTAMYDQRRTDRAS